MFARALGAVARACLSCAAWLIAALPSANAATRGVSIEIFGTPSAELYPTDYYLFQADLLLQTDVPVQFSVENAPRWAMFDPVWGRLVGTPSLDDVGTYDNIRVSATNGLERVSLPPFSIRVRSTYSMSSVSLSWEPPITNSDGSELTDLAGYRVYAGPSPADLRLILSFNDIGLTRYQVESLDSGPQYFAMSSINEDGVESVLTEPVLAEVP